MSREPVSDPHRLHTCTKHEPGEVCYQVCGCRCDGCREGWSRYRKRRQHANATGRTLRVPASEVLPHIRYCLASMSITDLARRATYHQTDLGKLLDGRQRHVYRSTAERLLAVTPTPLERGFVSSCGVRRRIDALALQGWRRIDIAERAGCSERMITEFMRSPRVVAATHRRIDAAYRALWDKPGPSPIAAARARTRGAVPAMAWDDDGPHGIDNPDAVPYVGCASKRLDLGEVAWLAEQGLHHPQIADRLGVTTDAIRAACKRAGRHDLWEATKAPAVQAVVPSHPKRKRAA